MKHLFLLLLLVFLSVPAYAQTQAAPEAPISKEKLALAEKMHEVWPIRTRIEAAIDSVGEQIPEEKRAEFKATMRKSIQYDKVEEASIKAMASTFTEEELKAMIDFYGSDIGRSISAKTSDYELALRPVFGQMMDKAVLDMRTGSPQ